MAYTNIIPVHRLDNAIDYIVDEAKTSRHQAEVSLEDAARKTADVETATVNFMTQKMIVEFAAEHDPESVMQKVRKACKKVEPDCEIFL